MSAREPLDTAAMRGLCERASAGPWTRDDQDHCTRVMHDGDLVVADFGGVNQGNDAAFACEARTALPAAVAEIEALRAVVEAVDDLFARNEVLEYEGRIDGALHARLDDFHAVRDALAALDACPGSPLLDGGAAVTPRLSAAVAAWAKRPEWERVEVGDGMTIDADAMCRPGSGWTTRDPDGMRRPMTREECESYAATLRAAVELLGAAGEGVGTP